MPRRYIRRRRTYSVVPKKKYSWEHYNFINSLNVPASQSNQAAALVIGSTNVLGMRKVKNFTINFVANTSRPIFFALVYVPEGTNPNLLRVGGQPVENVPNVISSASLYEPNQNVIMSGIIPPASAGRQVYTNKLARNLNSGDQVYLIFAVFSTSTEAENIPLAADISYCISF